MNSSLDTFPCSGCGSCCTRIGFLLKAGKNGQIKDRVVAEMVADFPYKARKNGSCSKLTKDGKCKVYDNRPDICNLETCFSRNYSRTMNKAMFFRMEAKVCNRMQEYDKVDKKYRIDATQFE